MALPNAILLQGTSGLRPAATTVAAGSLYFSTDTLVTEQSDGAVWTPYSGSGGGSTLPSTVQGDTLYASGVNTIAALTKDTNATRYLANTGSSNNPAWGQVALGTGVSGTLPIANGGTNSTTALSGTTIMLSNGTGIVQGTAGTTTTLLHGNAAGSPTYSAVSLTADVSGVLPLANGGTGSASGAGLLTARLTRNDAQIKALPSGAVQIVAAPASGFIIVPMMAVIRTNFGVGAYTGLSAVANLSLWWTGGGSPAYPLSFIPNDAAIVNPAIGTTALTDFFAASARKQVILLPYQNLDDETGNGWGLVSSFTNVADMDGKAVSLGLENALVTLGGGNAANTLTVDFFYFLSAV